MLGKKIVILCNSATGLNDFRGMLVDELHKIGYGVTAVVPISNNEIELNAEKLLRQKGCELIETYIDRRSINPLKDLKLFIKFWKILKQEKPDLVITYTIKPNVYGGFACRLMNIPYVINITGLGTAFENGGLLKKIVTVMNRSACKKAKVVFFENEGNQ